MNLPFGAGTGKSARLWCIIRSGKAVFSIRLRDRMPRRFSLVSLRREFDSARRQQADGNFEAAVESFSRIAGALDAEDPPGERTRLRAVCVAAAGECFLSQGDVSLAGRLADQAMTIDPDSVEALLLQASAAEARQDRLAAHARYQELTDRWPALARAWLQWGIRCRLDGSLDRAAEHLEKATTLVPGDPVAWSELGIVYEQQGLHRESVVAHQRALQLAPGDLTHYRRLALCLREVGELDQSLSVCLSGLRLAPLDAELLELTAESFLMQGDLDQAILAAQSLIRVCPRSPVARELLARAYSLNGAGQDALAMVDELVEICPTDPGSHFNRAVISHVEGRLQDAVRSYSEAARLSEGTALGEDARMALKNIDQQQLQQIVALAAEDIGFNRDLRRDPTAAARRRGFVMSAGGEWALEQFMNRFGGALRKPGRPAVYN